MAKMTITTKMGHKYENANTTYVEDPIEWSSDANVVV